MNKSNLLTYMIKSKGKTLIYWQKIERKNKKLNC